MTQNLNQEFVHLELGDYLELLQNTILVGGKRLNDKEICRKIMGHRTKRILRIERKEYQTY